MCSSRVPSPENVASCRGRLRGEMQISMGKNPVIREPAIGPSSNHLPNLIASEGGAAASNQ